jgi:hypothetical protein
LTLLEISRMMEKSDPNLDVENHPLPSSHSQSEQQWASQDDASPGPSIRKKDDPAFIVKFEDDDPENPMNFSGRYKAYLTFQMGMLALASSLGSSIIAPGQSAIAAYVSVSQEVAVLAVALYVLGETLPIFHR